MIIIKEMRIHLKHFNYRRCWWWVQLPFNLRKWAGLNVITTASRNETIHWVEKFGADYIINHHQPLQDQIVEFGIKDVDYIFA